MESGSKRCRIFNTENQLMMDVPVKHRICRINMDESHCAFPAMTKVDITTLWHQRMGHFNLISISEMARKSLVNGLPVLGDKLATKCSSCAEGKSHRALFPSQTTWRASKPLELVHTDLCGPFSTESQAGNKYFITFIDDFSRYCWVYFLRQKNQAFSCFKQFKSLVEANSGERLKCLRSDR